MTGVFVSYSRESEAAVKNLAADVEALEHTVWFDHDLSGGKVWWDQILAEIRNCQVFMMALSPESLRSVACTSEYGYAADLGKPILPILIADGVSLSLLPPKLSQIQFVDYRKQDKASAIGLARALRSVPPAASLPEPLPAPPPVPLSYLGRITEQIDSGAPLNPKDQSALVGDLRRGLRDAETTADARSLLVRLRKRDDLLAKIGDEIDELLEKPDAPPARTVTLAERLSTLRPAMPKVEVKPGARPRWIMRLALPAVIWSVMGTMIGGWFLEMGNEEAGLVVFPAIGGAIAGLISRTSVAAILLALVGGLLAALTMVIDGGSDRYVFTTIAVFALPVGAIVGATVGIVLVKLVRRLRAN